MDAQTKKAILRAKMKEAAQKRDKRIDSPLVRYNELDQPVCKVCNVAIKSDSLWPAHLASRKHNEVRNGTYGETEPALFLGLMRLPVLVL